MNIVVAISSCALSFGGMHLMQEANPRLAYWVGMFVGTVFTGCAVIAKASSGISDHQSGPSEQTEAVVPNPTHRCLISTTEQGEEKEEDNVV